MGDVDPRRRGVTLARHEDGRESTTPVAHPAFVQRVGDRGRGRGVDTQSGEHFDDGLLGDLLVCAGLIPELGGDAVGSRQSGEVVVHVAHPCGCGCGGSRPDKS